MKWKHFRGMYLNKKFRIFKEGNSWDLCDIRNGVGTMSPYWTFKTAKECMEVAEQVKYKPCGFYHKEKVKV